MMVFPYNSNFEEFLNSNPVKCMGGTRFRAKGLKSSGGLKYGV